jgi:hypothetical protein
VLYYRHVLGIELHQTPDYEAGEDFFTCYQGDVVFWRQVDKPVEGGIFVGYRGAQPAHVGLVLNRRRCTRAARTEAYAWTRCWSFSGHSPKWSIFRMALVELQRFPERLRTLQGAKRHPFL